MHYIYTHLWPKIHGVHCTYHAPTHIYSLHTCHAHPQLNVHNTRAYTQQYIHTGNGIHRNTLIKEAYTTLTFLNTCQPIHLNHADAQLKTIISVKICYFGDAEIARAIYKYMHAI